MQRPLQILVEDPTLPRCGARYEDWQGRRWACHFPPDHGGDHYGEDGDRWSWYSDRAVREQAQSR